MPPPLPIFRHPLLTILSTSTGVRFERGAQGTEDVLAAQDKMAGGRSEYWLLRSERFFDADVIEIDAGRSWLAIRGRFRDLSTGDEDGINKWVGPLPTDVAVEASNALRRTLKLPREVLNITSNMFTSLPAGEHWVDTEDVWQAVGHRNNPDFGPVRLRMPAGSAQRGLEGQRVRVRGCLIVPPPPDPRVPMTRGYGGMYLWVLECEPAAPPAQLN